MGVEQQARELVVRTQVSGECSAIDAAALRQDSRLRHESLRLLLADPRPVYRPLVCVLVDLETEEHKLHSAVSDDMMIATYLLAIERRVEDSRRLWEAKAANFSTWLGMSVVLLVAGGIDETLAYWKRGILWRWKRPARVAVDVIETARSDGRLADVDKRLAQIRTYCERSLARRARP